MPNIFRKNMNYEPKLSRNSKDMSYDNNFTTKFGQITPVFCQYVNGGESVDLGADLALQFKPTVFPLQTPVRVSVHYFKVPLRLLMEHSVWEDFQYGNRTDITLPYHGGLNSTQIKNMFKTGGLMDYLGVPTTYYGNGNYSYDLGRVRWNNAVDVVVAAEPAFTDLDFESVVYRFNLRNSQLPSGNFMGAYYSPLSYVETLNFVPTDYTYAANAYYIGSPVVITQFMRSFLPIREFGFDFASAFSQTDTFILMSNLVDGVEYDSQILDLRKNTRIVTSSSADTFMSQCVKAVNDYITGHPKGDIYLRLGIRPGQNATISLSGLHLVMSIGNGIDWCDLPDAQRIVDILAPLSIYARAYEMVYNSFYRSNQNVDPFTINGTPVYNRYLPNLGTGEDNYEYGLHFRNWDDDFLTTAYKSPQLGEAPLVGITNLTQGSFGSRDGVLSFQREDGTIATIKTELSDDGKVVKLDNKDLESESTTVRAEALKAVTQGISINDFRNVNAFQIWLERSMRRGRRYVDQLLAHTGVSARNMELDMPEFIGGFSRMVNVSKVNDTTSEGLGDYAGQLSLFGGSKHSSREYCDIPSVVIGLLTVVPQAAYSQLMPKFFSRRVSTDFFDPAFNKIGLQPISYREVCPIQAILEGEDVDATFGYQIPWYEDQSMVDEVHGQMRQIFMRDRLMNRTFGETPELSREFLHIDPEQVNDVFADRNPGDDPIVGQIHFKFYKKSQIFNVHIPGIM